jgi:hypothetical protein
MNKLLLEIIEAHGGLNRWRNFSRLEATTVTDSALRSIKGLAQDDHPREVMLWLHEERVRLKPFGDPYWRCDFTPDRVTISASDDAVVDDRHDPRAIFVRHDGVTPWDPLDLGYFEGYALWTCLNVPFVLTMPGVDVWETDPWDENGEIWRVLRARFPDTITTFRTDQDFFFSEDLLLRRHDYHLDIAAGFDAVHLMFDYIQANGINFPTRRRVYGRGPDRRPLLAPLMVSIDVSNVRFI